MKLKGEASATGYLGSRSSKVVDLENSIALMPISNSGFKIRN